MTEEERLALVADMRDLLLPVTEELGHTRTNIHGLRGDVHKFQLTVEKEFRELARWQGGVDAKLDTGTGRFAALDERIDKHEELDERRWREDHSAPARDSQSGPEPVQTVIHRHVRNGDEDEHSHSRSEAPPSRRKPLLGDGLWLGSGALKLLVTAAITFASTAGVIKGCQPAVVPALIRGPALAAPQLPDSPRGP